MYVMTSQILKFGSSPNTKKSNYLVNEKSLFLQIKKSLISQQGLSPDQVFQSK